MTVVYDGIGKATFDGSLAALRPRGYMVLYGAASGQVDPVAVQRLHQGGSLYLTRPGLPHYIATRDELLRRAGEVFGWIADGRLDVRIGARYPLAEARQAQEDLAGGARRARCCCCRAELRVVSRSRAGCPPGPPRSGPRG